MSDPDAITRLNAALEGRYHIERELGEGGMATVYLADDVRHERKVAVKVLKPELAAVVGAERFLAEIKTTANLQHPHILPLHDSGEADKFLFYVMPYVEGESLRDRLDREHQLPVDEAIRIGTNVAEALGYAHRRGVIHRDIKPANVLLLDGKPVLSDFGIALAVGAAGGGRLTETGLSLGTPHYMSPEQATGDLHVGPASDIYALACVLYEMLVGEPPFTGSTAQAVLGRIVTGEPDPVSKHRRSIAPNVEAAILTALDKVPADRFQRAEEFAAALGDPGFRGANSGAAASRAGSGRWKVATATLAVLCAVLGAALAVVTSRSEAPSSSLVRFTVPAPDGTAFGGNTVGGQIALSPDGRWIAFLGVDGTLYRRPVGRLEAEAVPGSQGASVPFFDPESRWLGFYSDRRLRKSALAGGPPVPITEAPPISGASWGEDDVIVFARNTSGSLHSVPGNGGTATDVPGADGITARYNQPWVLPGGGAALATTRGPASESRIVVIDLQTGAVDTLGFGTRAAFGMGHLVFTDADGTLFAQPFDPKSRRIEGEFIPMLEGVMLGNRGMGEFALSGQGGLTYLNGSLGLEELVIDGPAGSTVLPISETGDIYNPTFSPENGRRIALHLRTTESQDVWIFDRDTETTDRITVEGLVNMTPTWTPDGEHVALMGHRDEAPQGRILMQGADGTGEAALLLDTEYSAVPYSWSPDGKSLAFVGVPNGDGDIGLLTLGDPTPTWLIATEFSETQPQISPDGRWLAYASDLSGRFEVYVQPLNGQGSRRRVSTGGGRSPRWAANRGTLFFIRPEATGGTLIAASVSTDGEFNLGPRRERLHIDKITGVGSDYDVSPDGEEIVHVRLIEDSGRELVWILNWPEIVREMTSAR